MSIPEGFNPAVPDTDHRVITVRGFNIPEFPSDAELANDHMGEASVFPALEEWVDHALGMNRLPDEQGRRTPQSLWVPTTNSALNISRLITATPGVHKEYQSYLHDESVDVPVTRTELRHAIGRVPTQVGELDPLFTSSQVRTEGRFVFTGPAPVLKQTIGHISMERANYDLRWRSPTFWNERTWKAPAPKVAGRMALAAAKVILAEVGYDQKKFDTTQKTYGDVLAEWQRPQ